MNTDQTPYPLDLEAIRQRVEAATDPTGSTRWHVESESYSHHVFSGRDENHRDSVDIATYMHSKEDAVFIAHARADVPALLAEVERLHAGITDAAETARALCRQLACTPTCGCTCCNLRDDLVTLTRQTEGA